MSQTTPFRIGTRVYATRETGVCSVGEAGLVVEIYALGPTGAGRPGWSVAFEKGGFDGFSPAEVASMLVAEGTAAPTLAGYRFHSSSAIGDHLARPEFVEAFAGFEPYASVLARKDQAALEQACAQAPAAASPRI